MLDFPQLFVSDAELLGDNHWSLRHSFFADMGGFVLCSPDYEDGFPIDAEQLYYLVKHGHLDFPALTHREIKDMDVADKLSRYETDHSLAMLLAHTISIFFVLFPPHCSHSTGRLIALWQACFFSFTELVRVGRHLPMTTLELTTLSFSLTMVATSLCWFFKPQINRPIILRTKDDRRVADIRNTASRTVRGPPLWLLLLLFYISECT